MKKRNKAINIIKAILFFALAFMFIYLKLVVKLPYNPSMDSWTDMYIITNGRYVISAVFVLLGSLEIIEVIDK